MPIIAAGIVTFAGSGPLVPPLLSMAAFVIYSGNLQPAPGAKGGGCRLDDSEFLSESFGERKDKGFCGGVDGEMR